MHSIGGVTCAIICTMHSYLASGYKSMNFARTFRIGRFPPEKVRPLGRCSIGSVNNIIYY